MKVKLIQITHNLLDVIYTGARTCYSEKYPTDLWFDVCNITNDKKINLLDKVLGSGHHSVLEHGYVSFAVNGVSRVLLAQLSRHRFISLSVQSQRYVDMSNACFVVPENFKKEQLRHFDSAISYAEMYYDNLIDEGAKKEDARAVLPNATATNMVVSMNIRELVHLCNLRLCTRAQKEIRQLIKKMRDLVVDKESWLDKYLQPQCKALSYCPENNSCGRMKTLNELLNKEKVYDDKNN